MKAKDGTWRTVHKVSLEDAQRTWQVTLPESPGHRPRDPKKTPKLPALPLTALPELQPLILKEDSDSDTLERGDAQPSVPDWVDPPEEMPILPVPDEPSPMPADVASKPKEVRDEVAQIIGNLANVSDPSHRNLGEVVASINAVPRSTPSIPRDKHTNLGGSEPFKCIAIGANGEFIVLPGWDKARSLEKTFFKSELFNAR